MRYLIVQTLIVSVCCKVTSCNTLTTTIRPDDVKSLKKDEGNSSLSKALTWKEFIIPQQRKWRMENAKAQDSVADVTSGRKSRFLGNLALLAGASLAGWAASSSAKTIAGLQSPSPVTLNLGSSRLTPFYTTYHDPYAFLPHPYIYPNLMAYYSLLEAAKLQPLATGLPLQSAHQQTLQNPLLSPLITLLDNKRPISIIGNEDDYLEENKKAGGEKNSNQASAQEQNDRPEDWRVEEDERKEHLDEHNVHRTVPCSTPKNFQKKLTDFSRRPLLPRDSDDLQNDADDSLAQINVRATNTTTKPTTTNSTTAVPTIVDPPTSPSNSTAQNSTVYPYYEGSLQDISQIHLTTGSEGYRYPEYNQINYNSPYERPSKFYSNAKYPNFYGNELPNFYSTNTWSDQMPDYPNTDYGRFPYSPDNVPPYSSGFTPL